MLAGEEMQPKRLTRNEMLLAYVSGSFGFGYQSMIVFLLPLRARELGAPLAAVGLIVAAGSIIPGLLSIGSGAVVDRIGARRTFIACTSFTVVTAFAFALAQNYWVLGLLQLFNGFFRTSGWVASQTYVTGLGSPSERPGILGKFSFSANLGSFVGPLITGVIADAAGFRIAFVYVGAIGAIFPLVGLLLPEIELASRGQAAAVRGWGAMLALLKGRSIQAALVLTCVRLWLPSAWQPFYQIFLSDHGFRPFLIGTVLSASSATAVPTTLAAGRLSRWMSKESATAAALGLGALGVLVSPFVAFMPLAYVPAILLGVANGISLPLLIALMAEDAEPSQLGLALGLRTGINQLAAFVAPIAAGLLVPALGIAYGFGAVGLTGFGGLACALLLTFGRRQQRIAPIVSR